MTRRIKRIRVLLPVFLISALTSCSSDLIYSDVKTMPEVTWNLHDNPDFCFTVDDTTKTANVLFTIRTGSQYPFRNLFLFVTVTSPDKKIITDTLEYYLADEKGKWLGKGPGDLHELVLAYRQNVFFPQKGTYSFRVQHGMRIGDLRGVYDFGIRIEKFSR